MVALSSSSTNRVCLLLFVSCSHAWISMPPVRIPQRPHTALAAASRAPVTAGKRIRTRRRQWRARKITEEVVASSSSYTNSSSQFLDRLLVEHDILSKDREQQLGRAIEEARRIEEALQPLLEEQLLLRQQQIEADSLFEEPFDDDEEEDEDLAQLAVYGGYSEYAADVENVSMRYRRESSYDGIQTDWEDIPESKLRLAVGNRTLAQIKACIVRGARARQTLILSNVRLVVSIAKKWDARSSDSTAGLLGEAIQEGLVGLHTAVDKYDPSRNLRFATYATYWITSSIRRCFYINSTGSLRLPQQFYDVRARYYTLHRDIFKKTGTKPTFEELAKEMGLTETRLQTILVATRAPASLDAPLSSNSDYGVLLGDRMPDSINPSPVEWVEQRLLRACLERCLAEVLAPYERDILRLRLGLDTGAALSARQIAEDLGDAITVASVRQIEREALKKLRNPSTLSNFPIASFLHVAGVDHATLRL